MFDEKLVREYRRMRMIQWVYKQVWLKNEVFKWTDISAVVSRRMKACNQEVSFKKVSESVTAYVS